MDQEEKRQFEEEINLMDYIKVLLKRKWLILVVFLIAAIVAGAFSFFVAPKVYKIDTSLEIGGIDGQIIEEPSQVLGKIEGDVYGIKVREKLGILEGEYPKIKSDNPKATNLISLGIESSNTEKTKNILKEINSLILAEHLEKIKTQKELIEKNIKTAEGKIKLTESDIGNTRNKIKPIEGDIIRIENKIKYSEEEKENLEAKVEALEKVLVYEQTPGTQFALFDAKEKLANKKQEIEDLFLRINSLKQTKEDLEIGVNSLESSIESLNAQINSLRASLDNVRETKVVKAPTASGAPIKPRPLLNIVIAGVLGIFLGVFWAFGKEWWEKNK